MGCVNEFVVFIYYILISFGLIFSICIYFFSLEFYVLWVIVEGVFLLLIVVIISGGWFGFVYVVGIKVEKMKFFIDDFVDLSILIVEKFNVIICGRISISFSLEFSVDGIYY